jgi:hypothetical protein
MLFQLYSYCKFNIITNVIVSFSYNFVSFFTSD